MGLLDKAKAAAEQAATKAKEGVADVQTKRELSQAYDELGQATFELVDAGELSHPRLGSTVERIRALRAQLELEQQHGGAAASPTGGSPAAPS